MDNSIERIAEKYLKNKERTSENFMKLSRFLCSRGYEFDDIKEKFKFIHLKNIAFTKNNAKHYLISGFIIFITSFFIKYNIYYLVFTTLLFIFSGICYFKPSPKLPDISDEL